MEKKPVQANFIFCYKRENRRGITPQRFFILLSPYYKNNLKGNYATTGVSSVTRRIPVVTVRTVTITANTAMLTPSVLYFS